MNFIRVSTALLQTLVFSSALFAQTDQPPTPGGDQPPLPLQGGDGCVAAHSYTIFRGLEIAADISDFADSDDVRAQFHPGFVLANNCAPIWLIFDGLAPDTTQFLVESRAGTPGLRYTVEAWNWDGGIFQILGTQDEVFGRDQVHLFDIDKRHIDFAGNVRGRVGWRKVSFTVNFPWMVEIDRFAFCEPQ